LSGWYIIAAQLLAAVDFPIQLPVGDLSTIIKGASEYTNITRINERVALGVGYRGSINETAVFDVDCR
jgi:hypothetical protein